MDVISVIEINAFEFAENAFQLAANGEKLIPAGAAMLQHIQQKFRVMPME